MTNPSSRILLDIPCKVCHDHSSGKHYGIFACDGCAGFFKRSIRRNRQYVCKNRGTTQENTCQVDKTHRNQCRACRLLKCAQVGMNKDAVQHERGPRNSTLRRQMALYFKETNERPTPTFNAFPPRPFPFPLMPIFSSPPLSVEQSSPTTNSTSSPINNLTQTILPFHPEKVEEQPKTSTQETLLSVDRPPVCVDQSLKEQAARILFMILGWPKTLAQFVTLPQHEQIRALRSSWCELYMLGACQVGFLNESLIDKLVVDKEGVNVDSLKQVISQLQQLQPDAVEYSCLRALVLLDSAGGGLCEQLQLTLARYCQLQHSSQPLRSTKLFMLLPSLRAVSQDVLVKLLFQDTIGSVPMTRLVCDLYFSSPSNLAPQSQFVLSSNQY